MNMTGKLRRMIQYFSDTRDMILTLEALNMQMIKEFINASFAIHRDMKSHAGGYMTMSKGCSYGTSIRQRLNVKSSTEVELVAVSDVTDKVLLGIAWM